LFFFHPLNIVELSKKIVCSGGKLWKSSQVLYRSDQRKYFLKINQNYFAHICPEYGFRVNMLPASFPATVNNHAVVDNVKLPEHISNTCCACTYFLKLQHMHIRNDLLQNDVTSRKWNWLKT